MRSRFLLIVVVAALIATLACSGGSSQSSFTSTSKTSSAAPSAAPSSAAPAAATAPADTTLNLGRPSRASRSSTASVVQVTMGDDPADRVASLSLTINAITLISTTGSTAKLLSAPTTIEISSLAGTTTPLATVVVPAGTYNKAAIALGGATITVVDPDAGTTVQKTFSAPLRPFGIPLNPVFVSDGTALVINLSLDLHASVGFDSTGALTFNPLFLASHGRMVWPPIGIGPNPFAGGVERVMGTVTAVQGTSFTLTTVIGQRSLTFNTNNSTIFKGVSGVSALQNGMLVLVGGQAQSDGSLLALGVMVVDGLHAGPGAIGLVANTTGNPVTQFTLLVRGIGIGPMMYGMATPLPPVKIAVTVTTSTHFSADTDDVDMTGLSLTFDATSLSPAQEVGVAAAAPMATSTGTMTTNPLPAITFTAAQVRLVQQPVVGTIGNLTANSFTLTTPADGVFATLAKTNTITVYKQPGTVLNDGVTLANGQKVVVRGLLFNNSGYQMVARRIGGLP